MEWLIDSRSCEGRDRLRDSGQLKTLISEHATTTDWKRKFQLMQCFKNCLISSEQNAMYFLEEGFVQEAVNNLILLEDMKDHEMSSEYCRTALQFLANFVTCNEHCANTFWETYGIEMISRFFSLSVSLRSDPAFGATIAILHACISKDELMYEQRRRQLLNARQLCCQLALSMMDLQYSLSSSQENLPTSLLKNDQSLKWFHVFLLSLCLKGHSVDLIQLVGKNSSTSPSLSPSPLSLNSQVTLTHEQVIILNAYVSVFEDPLLIKQIKSQLQEVDTPPSILSFHSLVDYLSDVLTLPYLHQIQNYDRQCDSQSMESFSDRDNLILSTVAMAPSLTQALSIPSVPSILDCLSALILAFDEFKSNNETVSQQGGGGNDVRVQLSRRCVDDLCLNILASYKRKNTTPKKTSSSTSGNDEFERDYWNNLVKSCLNLLMQMSFRCEIAQDTIRTRGGLPVILSYCITDFDNPLCREFALMCIRNLCEGNIHNQQFIESLQPQQVLQDEGLLAQGIKIEIDPLSGRFKFHHESNSSS